MCDVHVLSNTSEQREMLLMWKNAVFMKYYFPFCSVLLRQCYSMLTMHHDLKPVHSTENSTIFI